MTNPSRLRTRAAGGLLAFGMATICAGPSAGKAPVATGSLPNLVVTGTRLDTPSTELGTSVSVITGEDLERRGFDFLVDAIAAVPGVTVNQNGAFGGVASVRIRGASSEQTLVLLDGVPVNDASSPGGGFNFGSLDPADVARIEILRGPQSVLWGSDAIGGVVNIITRRGDSSVSPLTGFLEGGSFDTLRGGVAVSGANDRGDFRLAVNGFDTQGISKADEVDGNTEDDGFESFTLNARGGLRLGERTRIDATVRYVEADVEFDSFGFETGVIDGADSGESDELSTTITAVTTGLAGDRLDLMTMVGYSRIDRSNTIPAFDLTVDDAGERLVLRTQATATLVEGLRVALGAEREESGANDDDTAINSIFSLWEYSPVDQLTLSAGARLDDHERYGSEVTARAALSYAPIDRLRLRASWGEGFKVPTIFQTTFIPFGATSPATDLEPERSEAVDIGVDVQLSARANLGITLFEQDFENLIAFGEIGYFNVGQATTRGVEIAGAVQINDLFGIGLTYGYLEARDGDGQRLIRLPQNSGDLEFTLTPDNGFSASLALRYNGEEDDARGVVERWLRVDATARYRLSERYELFGRVENIADAQYQQVFGYGTPGVSATLGFRGQL